MQQNHLTGGEDQKVLWMAPLKVKPVPQQQQQSFNCPRCQSSNTKFCYYNNYSLSQPRYFCKTCKRYWTHGGTLRNVPVGGGSRKNKRVRRPTKPPPFIHQSVCSLHPCKDEEYNNGMHFGYDLHPQINEAGLGFCNPNFGVADVFGNPLEPKKTLEMGEGMIELDSTSYWSNNNPTSLGLWLDPTNMGPYVFGN